MENDVKKRIKTFTALKKAPCAEDLAAEICHRRLERRADRLEQDHDALAWLDEELSVWEDRRREAGGWPPRDRPSIEKHPDYPRRLTCEEQEKIKAWCKRRVSKLESVPVLSSKFSSAERDELVASCRETRAVYLSGHEIDEVFAGLHERYPWLERLNEKAWRQALRRSRSGLPVGVGPLLITGPPGLGKSSWARSLAAALGVPSVELDIGTTGGVHDLQGTARGWASADRGRVVSSIVSSRVANPIVIMDEVDAGDTKANSTRGVLPGLFKVLMSMIEPTTARRWSCPYLQIPFDLTHLSWVATCNEYKRIDQPLIDRMTVIELSDMTRQQLLDFGRIQGNQRFGEGFGDLVAEKVDHSIRSGKRLSLRHVARMLDRIEEAMERPLLH